MKDEKTLNYVDGTAVHWYSYGTAPFEIMNFAKTQKKELFVMSSEACTFFVCLIYAFVFIDFFRLFYY